MSIEHPSARRGRRERLAAREGPTALRFGCSRRLSCSERMIPGRAFARSGLRLRKSVEQMAGARDVGQRLRAVGRGHMAAGGQSAGAATVWAEGSCGG